jgi:predicted acyl esterase
MSGFAKKGSSAAGSLVAAPKTLRYEHDGGLPVAIEAKSNRRAYVPNNGSTFSPGQTIRLNLNSQSFIDFSHSYLQFKWTNKTGVGVTDRTVGLDMGCPFFSQ